MNKQYVIGTNTIGYPQKRNYGGLPFHNFSVKIIFDVCKFFDFLYFKAFHNNHLFFHNTFFDLSLNNVDVLHFFNAISLSNKPWIVTFENQVPYDFPNSKHLVKRLTHKSCKKIIAFSNRAKAIEIYYLEKHPAIKKVILDKLIVLQPPQELYIQSINEKDYSQPITFTFVGVDFFRKGGMEVLNAIEKLMADGLNFQVNIVSRLKYGGWKDEHITERDVVLAKEKIEKLNPIVSYYYSLPHDDIINLFKKSHVGLLPSYGETYGYVGLEAQANGCAVITPNMPPFDDFNNIKNGWLINVPLKKRNGTLESDIAGEKLIEFQNKLKDGLYQTMKEAITNIDLLKEKAANSIENIRNNHSPEKAVEILEEIYFNAIQNK